MRFSREYGAVCTARSTGVRPSTTTCTVYIPTSDSPDMRHSARGLSNNSALPSHDTCTRVVQAICSLCRGWLTLRYSPVCSSTYTRRFSVPLAHDLMTNSQVRPAPSFTGKLYDLHTHTHSWGDNADEGGGLSESRGDNADEGAQLFERQSMSS